MNFDTTQFKRKSKHHQVLKLCLNFIIKDISKLGFSTQDAEETALNDTEEEIEVEKSKTINADVVLQGTTEIKSVNDIKFG